MCLRKVLIKFPVLMMLMAALGLSMLERIAPMQIYLVFAYPAAFIASSFWGARPLVIENSEIWIPLPTGNIHVTPECSGYGFFCLVLAMLLVYSMRSFARRQIFPKAMFFVPAAYILTILINAIRIISAYKTHELAKYLFPANFQAVLHLWVGIVVFLPALITLYLILERVFKYERA